jgi:hypothetical protein
MHDYVYLNDTADEWTIYNSSITVPNTYHGSAVCVVSYCYATYGGGGVFFCRQQAVLGLANLPLDMFQGSPNKRLVTMSKSSSIFSPSTC